MVVDDKASSAALRSYAKPILGRQQRSIWEDASHSIESIEWLTLLLPDLDALHNHLTLPFPCWQPRLLCIPEVPLRKR